jgi:hypothetical protein
VSKSSRRRKHKKRRKAVSSLRSRTSEQGDRALRPPNTPPPVDPIRFFSYIRSAPKKLAAAILGVATLLGYVVLAPRLAVDPPLIGTNPAKPFDGLFTLTNKGNFSLYKVNATCADPIIGGNPAPGAPLSFDPKHPFILEYNAIVPVFSVPKLEPEQPQSFPCNNFTSIASTVPITINHCGVKILVDFKLLGFVPWGPKTFPLEANLGQDGKLHWSHPVLIKEPPP